MTNVPGPQVPIYFCGARALYTTGSGPVVNGIGLFHGIGSYGGYMNICFSSDRVMMPDPEFYEQCIDRSVAELLKGAKRLSKPRRSVKGTSTTPQKSAKQGGQAARRKSSRTGSAEVAAPVKPAKPRGQAASPTS